MNQLPLIPDYHKEVDFTISICDKEGKIVYLNDRGVETFKDDGGLELLGSNILDCHPEPSKSQLKEMFISHETNFIFKGQGSSRRLIYQTPIFKEKEYNGYMEMIIPIPEQSI